MNKSYKLVELQTENLVICVIMINHLFFLFFIHTGITVGFTSTPVDADGFDVDACTILRYR